MLSNVATLFTGWKGYVVAGMMGALLAAAGTAKVQAWRYGAQLANQQTAHSKVLEEQAQAVVASVEAARTIEKRRAAAVEEQRDIAQRENEALAAGLAAGRDMSERLRQQLATLRARARGDDPGAAQRGEGEQGPDTIGLLIDMYQGLDDAGRAVSEYADRLRVAGLGCESIYDRMRGE